MRNTAETNLSPQDVRLLGLLREGCVDAEIAVRLGTTTPSVKARVAALVDALGVRGRVELAEGAFEDVAATFEEALPLVGLSVRVSGRQKMARAAAFVVGIAAGVAVMTLLGQFALPRQAQTAEPVGGGAVAVGNSAADAGAVPVMRDGRPEFDTGELFGGKAAIERRGDAALVRLAAGADVQLGSGNGVQWRATGTRAFPSGVSLSGFVDGRVVSAHVLAAEATTSVRLTPGGLGISASSGSEPAVLVWVDEFSSDVGTDGHLYIGAERPVTSLVAYDTGEEFESGGLAPLSLLAEGSAWFGAFCGDGEACHVVARLGSHASFGCEFEVLEGGYRVQFASIERTSPTCAGARFRISAVSAAGAPVSVLADGRGVLYAGRVERQFGCPCRSGS